MPFTLKERFGNKNRYRVTGTEQNVNKIVRADTPRDAKLKVQFLSAGNIIASFLTAERIKDKKDFK